MSSLLRSGDLQHHIFDTLQPAYARRYHRMISAIDKYLVPLGITLSQTDREVVGGYFIWITIPRPLLAEQVAIYAKRDQNLVIAAGPIFGVYGDEKVVDLTRKVRLCFSWEDENKLAMGVQRLSQVIARMQRGLDEERSAPPHPEEGSSCLMEQFR